MKRQKQVMQIENVVSKKIIKKMETKGKEKLVSILERAEKKEFLGEQQVALQQLRELYIFMNG